MKLKGQQNFRQQAKHTKLYSGLTQACMNDSLIAHGDQQRRLSFLHSRYTKMDDIEGSGAPVATK